MINRERQRHLDLLAMRFVAALDAGDFAALDELWALAATDKYLEETFVETVTAWVETHDEELHARAQVVVVDAVQQHMPSAELINPTTGPITVAEVAEFLRRHPHAGLTTDDLNANDRLRQSVEIIPAELGLSHMLEWGKQFGAVPETYWRAFRQAALKLRMRREPDTSYQLAARASKNKGSGNDRGRNNNTK